MVKAIATLIVPIDWFKKQNGRVKFTLITLLLIAAIVFFAIASSLILAAFRLTYRHWVISVGFFLLLLLVAAFSCGLIACLQMYKKRFAVLIRTVGTIVLLAAVGFGGFWGCFISIFYTASIEEQMVERDGTKMLAEVSAFLDVDVYYYDYKNWFVRSEKYRIHE
ncbi:hypothetical protein [Paenibacillus glycanilyticus]|uniref:hypothetical protein n=1 Tax=Paenibacillus glycanilyticus TaxID=126569 RepID=UPI0024E166F7|nr:hypothetical protein [Paenibacillus glycanilyticus]